MDQKGSGPKTKDKTIDGFAKSNEKQAKYSSHLIAKDAASDFGNMTRSKRWRQAEMGLMGLLALSSIIGLIAFFMPFMTRTNLVDGSTVLTPISGMDAFKDTPISTTGMLGFVAMIVLLVLTIVKLAATVVPALDFMNKTPVAIAHGVVSALALVLSIVVFGAVVKAISDLGYNLETTNPIVLNDNSGMGTTLLLIGGIAAAVTGIMGALTRLRINTLKDSTSGKSNSQPSGGAM